MPAGKRKQRNTSLKQPQTADANMKRWPFGGLIAGLIAVAVAAAPFFLNVAELRHELLSTMMMSAFQTDTTETQTSPHGQIGATASQSRQSFDGLKPMGPPNPFSLVDQDCRVWHTDQFMTDDEINAILALVDEAGGWGSSRSGGPTFQVPKTLHSRWDQLVRSSAIVRVLEDRIANVTGIPIHPAEDMVTLANMYPYPDKNHDGYFAPWGLHHETDQRPFRARTVIIYLNDVEEGGHTIFPLCNRTASPPSASASAATSDFENAIQSMWGDVDRGFHRHVDFDFRRKHMFNDYLADCCRGQRGLSFKPRRGSAVMFDSMLPTHDYNRRTWHGGCNVVKGNKILLQKFKELPLSDRWPLSFQQPTPYHPYVLSNDPSS